MRVLVVHDRDGVSAQIKSLLDNRGVFSDVATHYVAASQLVRTNLYDLAIIDLTLPHLSRGRPNYEVARNFIEELFSVDDLNAPGDLIGITNDKAALAIIQNDFSVHLMSVIEEDSGGGWLRLLGEKVDYVRRSSRARYEVTARTFDIDALIVCALDEEADPFEGIFELQRPDQHGTREFGFADKHGNIRRGAIKAIGRAGTAAAVTWTQNLLARYRPRLALMSGICAAVKGKASLGDVILMENVFDWDFGKWKAKTGSKAGFFARPEPVGIRDTRAHQVGRELSGRGIDGLEEILTHANGLGSAPLTELRIRLAPSASGSAVIAAESLTDEIKRLNENIAAIDMEAYGFYYACKYTLNAKPEMLCIKSACDYADGDKGDDWHEVCAYLSAAVIGTVLTGMYPFE